MARNIAVTGIYVDQVSAGEGADALQRAGFRNTDTAMLLPDNIGSKDYGYQKHSKAPDRAMLGVVIGMVLGAGCGWLVSRGGLGNPGSFASMAWLAPFTSISLIAAVLSGIGAGSVVGLLIGALIGSGTPEYEAVRYEGRTRRGGVLLSVHCDNADWTGRAKGILRETGAKDIAARTEAKADFGASEKPVPRTRTAPIIERRNRVRDEVDLPVEDQPVNDEHASVDVHRQ